MGCGDYVLHLMANSDENNQACLVFRADFKYAIIFLVGPFVQKIHKSVALLFQETMEKKLLSRK